MGGLTSTIVLLVVLGGLGGYIYFVESRNEPRRSRRQAEGVRRSDGRQHRGDPSSRTPDGETSRVQRVGDELAARRAEDRRRQRRRRHRDEQPGDARGPARRRREARRPRAVRAEPATHRRRVPAEDQKDFQRLLVGEKTPTGGDLYAKRPEEKRVFLISSFLDAIFNKTPFDLRDKSVLKFERDKADGIEVVSGGNSTAVREKRHGLAHRQAYRRPRRLRRRRGTADPAVLDVHAEGRRPRSRRPEDVRTRPAGDDRDGHERQLAGDAAARPRRRRRLFAKDAGAARGLHRRGDARHRARQGRRRLPPQGFVRRAVVHGEPRSRSAGAPRPWRSRRASADGKDHMEERRGPEGRHHKVEDLLTKLSNIRAAFVRATRQHR